MITIKQASEMMEVTPQAIYKRINDTEANNGLLNCIVTNDKGQKCINDDGLKILRAMFNKVADIKPALNENSELIELLKNSLKASEEQVKRLYDEIRELKDEHREAIKRKDDRIETLEQRNDAIQGALFSMQQAKIEAPGRKGLFSWLKKGGSDEQ